MNGMPQERFFPEGRGSHPARASRPASAATFRGAKLLDQMDKRVETPWHRRREPVVWNAGEREALIADALANGKVTQIPAAETGPEQIRSSWPRKSKDRA